MDDSLENQQEYNSAQWYIYKQMEYIYLLYGHPIKDD